jgi:succinyl-CoA synthetase alpha subunit
VIGIGIGVAIAIAIGGRLLISGIDLLRAMPDSDADSDTDIF